MAIGARQSRERRNHGDIYSRLPRRSPRLTPRNDDDKLMAPHYMKRCPIVCSATVDKTIVSTYGDQNFDLSNCKKGIANMHENHPLISFLTVMSHDSGASAEGNIVFFGFIFVVILLFLYRRFVVPKMRMGAAKRFVLQNKQLAKETFAHIKALCDEFSIPFDIFLRIERLDRNLSEFDALNEASSDVDWAAARSKLVLLAEEMNRLADDIDRAKRTAQQNSMLRGS